MRSPRKLVRDTITGRFTRRQRAQSAPTLTVTETTPSQRIAEPLSARISIHGLLVKVRLHAGLTPVHTIGLETDDTADAVKQVRHALMLLAIPEDPT